MTSENKNDTVLSVIRVFGILELLAKEKEMGLSDLAKQIYAPKSTLFRFLQTMKELGYVIQDAETEKYSLTVKVFQVGANALGLYDINKISNPHMKQLSKQTHETVHMAVLDIDSKSIIYVHKIDSEFAMSMMSRIGKKAPIYCTALGKILAAFSSQAVLEKLLENMTFQPLTPNTITNREDFLKELEKIKKLGYAEDMGENEENFRCIAVPIKDRFGDVVAGLSTTWPEFRFNETDKKKAVNLLIHTAKTISEELGFCQKNTN